MILRLLLIPIIILSGMLSTASAQEKDAPVELFCGADLHYADVNFIRLYDLLVYLTPGMKWHMGNNWQVSAQAMIPIINNGYFDYTPEGKRYEMVRLGNASISKELHFNEARQHLKLSAGLFGSERWGADVKWVMPVNDWLLLRAQGGLTRHWALGYDLGSTTEADFDGKWTATAQAGFNVYLRPWDTEVRMTAGRYINEDKGLQVEVMRHFPHLTAMVYAQLHEKSLSINAYHREAGGFKIIVMLPTVKAYSQSKAVKFRPATNFRFTYNAQSDDHTMRTYFTDPEENERELPVKVESGEWREKSEEWRVESEE